MKIIISISIWFILLSCGTERTQEQKIKSEIEIFNSKAHELANQYTTLVRYQLDIDEFKNLQRFSSNYDTSNVAYKEEYSRKELRAEKAKVITDSVFEKMVSLRKEIPNLAVPKLDDYSLTANKNRR